jgi:GT2 family glycosyltransferase
MSPRLDIVIVSFNAREDLRRCLASLREAPPHVSTRLIVVDSASRDGSPDVVREVAPDATIVVLAQNAGFSRANNIGIRSGDAELILLLNGDTIVPAGAIDGLAAALDAEPSAAAAGPRLVDARGVPELSLGRMMSPWNELRQKLIGGLHARGIWPGPSIVQGRTSRRSFPDWVSGAALLVRRADAEAVGLLDERFVLYTEDVDFCASLRARGRKVLFTPAVTITHLRGRSTTSAPAQSRAMYRRSHVAFYEKHHPRWAPWLRAYLRIKGEWPPRGAGGPVLS